MWIYMFMHVCMCWLYMCKLTLNDLVAASVSSVWRPARTYKAKLALFSKLIPWINS